MFCIKRFSLFSLFIIALTALVQKVFAADEFTSYLFAFFTGNDIKQETIHFAISNDAHSFKALNKNNPVLNSSQISSEGGVRDPHILRGENNDYYMVATDMVSAKGWASNHGLVMLRSTNLIDWKSSAVDIRTAFSQYQSADRVWAPQTIFDPVEKKYMIYFAMRLGSTDIDKIYYSYADSTFTKLETAPKLLYKYGNIAAIDADIIYKDSTYHLFFKTEGSSQKQIKSALSKSLTDGYTLLDKALQVTNQAVEGSCVFKLINSDKYILMYDVYNSGKYEFAISTDLKNFTLDPTPISFDFTPHHGTIIPITDAEKKALLAKWDPTVITATHEKTSQFTSYRLQGKVLYLSFENVLSKNIVILIDISGKTVLSQTIPGKSARIDLSYLPPGIYHVLSRINISCVECSRIVVR